MSIYSELSRAPQTFNDPHMVESHCSEKKLGGVRVASLAHGKLVYT